MLGETVNTSGNAVGNTGRFGMSALCALVTAFICTSPVHAATLKADPDVLVFHRTDQSVTTSVTLDGQPLPAGAMGEVKLWASGHDYDEMFQYDRSDGQLKLTPTAECEVGSYDLVVKTSAGDLALKVYTPLDEMPGTLKNIAASMGITVDELRQRMALVTPLGPVEVSIALPEVYYEGQAIELELEDIEGATHTWKINGNVVAQGPEATKLEYILKEPGLVVLEYTAERDGQTITGAKDSSMVVKVPPVEWKAPRNVEFTLHATPGYGTYTWTIDAKPAGQGKTLTHTFKEAGPVTIECLCEEPESGPKGTFLRIAYAVEVTP